jgi:hypothetical protein
LNTVEKIVIKAGLARSAGQTSASWLHQLGHIPPWNEDFARLQAIFNRHCRYRFDPQGLTPAERQELRSLVEEWLQNRRV